MRQILIMLLTIAISGNIYGEIRTLTLSNVIDMALLNNLDIIRASQYIEVAEAQYGQALANFAMPSISALAGYTIIDQSSVQNGMINYGPYTLTNVFPDNYKTGLAISKPLFSGFRLWNTLNIKKGNLDLARMKYSDKKKEIMENITASFYNLFLIRENIKMIEDLNRSLKESVEYARNAYLSGNATEYDYIRANVQYQNNLPELLQMRNSFVTAKKSFCQQIGISDPDSVEFMGNLYSTTNITLLETNKENILKIAFSNDIRIKESEVNIQNAKLRKNIEDGGKMPMISTFFNYNFNYEKTNSVLPVERVWNPSWNAGIQLTMPIDSLIPVVSKNWNSTLEAEKNIAVLETQREQLKNDIALQVESLLLQINQNRESMKSREENVRQAQYAYRLARERYRQGSSSVLEVIDSQAAMSKSEAGYLEAIYAYFSDSLKLKNLIGE